MEKMDNRREKLEYFLQHYLWDEVTELGVTYPDNRSLYIPLPLLDQYDPPLVEALLETPDVILSLLDEIISEISLPSGVALENAHVRITTLLHRVKLRDVRFEHVGKLVSLEGIVTKVTKVIPWIVDAAFECPFCHHIFSVIQSGLQFKEPVECERESGGCGRKVQHFRLLVDKSKFVNAQKIRLQESPEELRGGELPQALDVNLIDDLSGIVSPGARVIVTGILRSYQRITRTRKTLFFDLFLDGNSFELKEEEFEEIKISEEDEREIIALRDQRDVYDKLVDSIAPAIYGYREIKEALLLQLFGGVSKTRSDGTNLRGDIHVLIVGDPGVAKSQLLYYMAKLAPRGIFTTGKSSTGVGLTAAVVKDEFGEGGWSLEAGALVLADKGFAAVDELDKMDKNDRFAIHEAMEQQRVSIAKAGITTSLNSRTALLAAANPKLGRFDRYTPISEQIDLPTPLLSRFDMIFTILDIPSLETDRATASHILKVHRIGAQQLQMDKKMINEIYSTIPHELMRKYIAYSKRTTVPQLTDEADRRINDFYVSIRNTNASESSPIPITVRQLESLIRLSEARARTRMSDEVSVDDVDDVIKLFLHCLKTVFSDPETGQLDVDHVIVGVSKSRRDRARSIIELMHQLEREYGDEIPVDDIIELAVSENITREKAEEIIELMKRDGIIFSPCIGMVKFVQT